MQKQVTKIPTRQMKTTGPSPQLARRKVAAYARVSTDFEDQITSYEAQVRHYEAYIKNRADWVFAGIYTDATVIIGLKQNPTIGRRFSPIFSFFEHLSGKYGRCYT